MTTTDTRTEARAALAAWDEVSPYYGPTLHRLATALRNLLDEHDALVREMHQRELHHFEAEKLLTEAGINPDEPVPTEDWEYTTADYHGQPDMERYRAWGSRRLEGASFRRRKAGPWEEA